MKVIGVTGSIGMGKSTITSQLRELGALTYNADDSVHALLGEGGRGVEPVAQLFPAAKVGNRIDRAQLGALVFNLPDQRKLLESILHPLVREEEARFIESARKQGASCVALDIPLLFETNGEKRCDITLVASAPYFIQRKRVLARHGMTEEKFLAILAAQMPDREKRKRADHVIYTGLGRAYSYWQLKRVMAKLCVK